MTVVDDGLFVSLVGVLVVLAVAYGVAPVGECDQCLHCRHERVKRAERERQAQLALRHEYAHRFGTADCDDVKCPRNRRR